MLSQHGIAAWVDDVEMEEQSGVYKMNTESMAFFLLNAAFLVAQRECVIQDGEILAGPDKWLSARLEEEFGL